ncbi:hypothetical protein Lepto7375DRAFT_7384 [Leptolyngbya sp. PCC 7375]|nr:hypothetical protein Lepto7375DRAFT_7384 [Leptolyngbya sp. PCC 7375]
MANPITDSRRTFEYSLPEFLTLSEDAFLIGERRGCGVSLVRQAVSFTIPFADTKRIVPTPRAVRIAHHAAVDVVFRVTIMFDIDMPSLEELFATAQEVGAPVYEVTFLERNPEGEGCLHYDVDTVVKPFRGQVGTWYKVIEVLEIDHEGKRATVVFEFPDPD